MTDKRLLTPEEVCTLLGIKMSKFRSAVFKKQIPVVKLGRLVRVDPKELEEWINSQKLN